MDYLACDLGAESGRIISGTLENGRLQLNEIHRFANVPLREGNSLHWNFQNIILEIKEGLRKAAATGRQYASISADSWGVDYVLFDSAGEILLPVHHYRDARTKLGVERVYQKISPRLVFEETGIQQMPINTLFQLAAENPERLTRAALLLGVGDAINFFLSGVAKQEVSLASTFQLYDPRKRNWSELLISQFSFPRPIFPEIVPSGSRLGKLRGELARELGLPQIEVVATCSHDTGAAVAGVPASDANWAYLSSGTWSLMGVELTEPVINDQTLAFNFTNEIGFGHSVRLLKNLSGLWVIQQCKKFWADHGHNFSYEQLTRLASESRPFKCLINPAHDAFLAPESMPAEIESYCRRTGQEPPAAPGEFIRCALESLALLYKQSLARIEAITGTKVERLHIVGGGSNNELLNQFTANALGTQVLAGPAEATAAGNVLIQAISSGQLGSLREAREVARRSFPLKTFQPEQCAAWEATLKHFQALP